MSVRISKKSILLSLQGQLQSDDRALNRVKWLDMVDLLLKEGWITGLQAEKLTMPKTKLFFSANQLRILRIIEINKKEKRKLGIK
jgi:hypothetical protein